MPHHSPRWRTLTGISSARPASNAGRRNCIPSAIPKQPRTSLPNSGRSSASRCSGTPATPSERVSRIASSGTPTTSRHIGYATRGTYIPVRRSTLPGVTVERFPGYGHYTEEVELTEYVYNFGPRKLMRRLLFEGGVLVKIETIGYGYREKNSE